MAIEITGAAEAGEGLGIDGLGFDFFAVALVRIVIPEKRWRVRPLGSLTLTLSLPRFVPPICAHHVTGTAVKA
jgi:hypothetical protein